MGVINVSLPTDGTTADVADVNTPITTIVNEFNGNIDNANIKSAAAIATSKLADDAGITTAKIANGAISGAKISTYKTIEQVVTTNTTPTTSIIQEGWNFVNANATATTTKAITFPQAFSTITQFQAGVIGVRTTSDPAAITDFNVGIGGEQLTVSTSAISITGATVQLTKSSNFSSGSRYGFWWRVIGT